MSVHDDRSIPMDPEPLPAREGYFFRLLAKLVRRDKNLHDEAIAKAAERNRPFREAEARRTLAQPGASAEAVAKAERVFARIGSGAKK